MLSMMLALALAAAEPQASAPPPAGPAAQVETARQRKARERAEAKAKIECREMPPTGSSLPQTICLSVGRWERMREDAVADARIITDASPDALVRGR